MINKNKYIILDYNTWLSDFYVKLKEFKSNRDIPKAFTVSFLQWDIIVRDCYDSRLDFYNSNFMGLKPIIHYDSKLTLLTDIP